jgi:hypothetical protein
MNFETIKQLANKNELTIDEIRIILDYIVNTIKSKLDINDSYTRLCKESSMEVWNLCNKLNILYIPFNLGSFDMSGMEHHFGIISFQTEYGKIYFLIDLTYSQYVGKTYLINAKTNNSRKLVSSPCNFISEENKNQLLQFGYLTLTDKNFEDYISSFIESYRSSNSIDERNTYDKAYDLLEEYNINFVEKDYLKNESITY